MIALGHSIFLALLTIALENLAALEAIKPLFRPLDWAQLAVFSAVFLVRFYGAAGIAMAIECMSGIHSRWLIG